MFAVLIINHITTDAGRELALSVQAFFMSADIVSIFIKIWHLGTPVYALNGRTAFVVECDKQRVRPGCFFYYTLCYKINHISTAHCLAPARRLLTKRASASTAPTPSVSTTTGAAVAAVRQTACPCVSSSSPACNSSTQTSASLKSKTAAPSSSHASRPATVRPSIVQPSPCLIWHNGSTTASHTACPDSEQTHGLYFAHLIHEVSKPVTPLKHYSL